MGVYFNKKNNVEIGRSNPISTLTLTL